MFFRFLHHSDDLISFTLTVLYWRIQRNCLNIMLMTWSRNQKIGIYQKGRNLLFKLTIYWGKYSNFYPMRPAFEFKMWTRKHSRRMHFTHLETLPASVLVAPDVAPGGPQMNKFGQVFSDHHPMSLAERARCNVQGTFPRGYPTMWRIPWCIWCYLSPCEQTDACQNTTFPQRYLRAVMKRWGSRVLVTGADQPWIHDRRSIIVKSSRYFPLQPSQWMCTEIFSW